MILGPECHSELNSDYDHLKTTPAKTETLIFEPDDKTKIIKLLKTHGWHVNSYDKTILASKDGRAIAVVQEDDKSFTVALAELLSDPDAHVYLVTDDPMKIGELADKIITNNLKWTESMEIHKHETIDLARDVGQIVINTNPSSPDYGKEFTLLSLTPDKLVLVLDGSGGVWTQNPTDLHVLPSDDDAIVADI